MCILCKTLNIRLSRKRSDTGLINKGSGYIVQSKFTPLIVLTNQAATLYSKEAMLLVHKQSSSSGCGPMSMMVLNISMSSNSEVIFQHWRLLKLHKLSCLWVLLHHTTNLIIQLHIRFTSERYIIVVIHIPLHLMKIRVLVLRANLKHSKIKPLSMNSKITHVHL